MVRLNVRKLWLAKKSLISWKNEETGLDLDQAMWCRPRRFTYLFIKAIQNSITLTRTILIEHLRTRWEKAESPSSPSFFPFNKTIRLLSYVSVQNELKHDSSQQQLHHKEQSRFVITRNQIEATVLRKKEHAIKQKKKRT